MRFDPLPISDEELDAMEVRCTAASSGPWKSVVFEGLEWITRKVVEDGVVTGGFERPLRKRSRLRD